VARKLAILLLILLILLLVIPLGIGMAMAPCPECDAGAFLNAAASCAALLALAAGLSPVLLTSHHRMRLLRPRCLLLVRNPDPPPRLA
jgi:hypothetical protein